MNLDLTKKDFLALLKAVYLADYMANVYAVSPAAENREMSAIRRKIFSMAEEAGFEELVQHDSEKDDYFESVEFADELEKDIIEKYVERLFWNELRIRLTDKIMDAEFGAEIDGWNELTYRQRRMALEKKVQDEFETNGIINLFLLGDFRF